mgnify:CR=1 FL=1|tara:strand:+ start:422 stop:706 length:285 start_codon:yes stop_codon:yes gene_type:complete
MIENLQNYLDKDILNYCIHLFNVEKQMRTNYGDDYLNKLNDEALKTKFEKQYDITVQSLMNKNNPIVHLLSLTKAYKIIDEKLLSQYPNDEIPF